MKWRDYIERARQRSERKQSERQKRKQIEAEKFSWIRASQERKLRIEEERRKAGPAMPPPPKPRASGRGIQYPINPYGRSGGPTEEDQKHYRALWDSALKLKRASIVLGIGLVATWAVALALGAHGRWLYWLDGFVGLFSFMVGLAVAEETNIAVPPAFTFLQSGLLFALWLVTFGYEATPWLRWTTLGFAVVYLAIGAYHQRTWSHHRGLLQAKFRRAG